MGGEGGVLGVDDGLAACDPIPAVMGADTLPESTLPASLLVNLRLARPTWMPAVLCEGAFLMIPEQEAALRTPAFQRAYAMAIVDGLENYFRSLPSR